MPLMIQRPSMMPVFTPFKAETLQTASRGLSWFNSNMVRLYGEGGDLAFRRLKRLPICSLARKGEANRFVQCGSDDRSRPLEFLQHPFVQTKHTSRAVEAAGLCHDQIKGSSRLMHLGKPQTDLIATEIDLPTEKVSGHLDLGRPVEEGSVDACVAPESEQWIATLHRANL